MKKKIIFNACFLFLLISSFISNAQDIKSVIDTNKIWSVLNISYPSSSCDPFISSCEPSGSTIKYKIGSDTVIEGISYKKVLRKDKYYPYDTTWIVQDAFLREDSTEKIYYQRNENEHLLYDFSVKSGDTISRLTPYNWIEVTVGIIDSILINGEYHNRIEILGECGVEEYWIEGIGSTLGLFSYCDYNNVSLLLCCHVDKQLIYSDNTYNSCDVRLTVDDHHKSNTIRVHPTLVYSHLKVVKYNTNPVKLSIYNIFGKQEKEIILYDTRIELDCTTLRPGIYVLVFREPESCQILKTIKIIKQ